MCLAMRKAEKTRGHIPQNIRGYIPQNIMEQGLERALTGACTKGLA